jgi:hypothetical protein
VNVEEPRTRRERLATIAEEHTEKIAEPRTAAQLSGAEPVCRYAAVTSAGPRETAFAERTNLIVAETAGDLAELLRRECEEGYLAYWRVWDLDAPWDPWGNLEAACSVRVGEEVTRPVHVVEVEGRPDGPYLFDDLTDAEAFAAAVRRHGGEARLTTNPLHDHRGADGLIDEEARR